MHKWLSRFAIVSLVLALGAGMGWLYYQKQLDDFLAQPMQLQQAQVIHVPAGLSSYRLLRAWQKNGWIRELPYLRGLFWRQPHWRQIRAGTYQIQPEWPLSQALEQLISGAEHQYAITFVEGSRWRDWLQHMQQAPDLVGIGELENSQAVLEYLKLDALSLEGWLYPDTYFYTAGTSALALIERAHSRMRERLNQLWSARNPLADAHLASPYEALILASIIEKETGYGGERATISSVFHNRFAKKMRLQTDPTVIYGMGEAYQGNITKADLRQPTPYNTYLIKGLPPTPIAMPSELAIQAAVQPEQTNYYYFVSQGDGRHVFSSTLKEHNSNVRRYLLQQE